MTTASPPPGTVPVRLTIRPYEITYVDPAEIPGLGQQGLLEEDPEVTAAAVLADAQAATPSRGAPKATVTKGAGA